MRMNPSRAWLMLPAILCVPPLALSQTSQHKPVLIVVGQSGQAPIVRMNGKSYVDLESLARLVNGSLSFAGNQTRLKLPVAERPRTAPPASTPENHGFSKPFVRAAIETMSTISAWRGVIADNIRHSYPFDETWFTGYIAEANKNLGLASVAVSTESDRNAYQLLSQNLDNMRALTNEVLDNRKSMHYMPPGYLDDNSLNQKILNCDHSLASMAASGEFADDGSCR